MARIPCAHIHNMQSHYIKVRYILVQKNLFFHLIPWALLQIYMKSWLKSELHPLILRISSDSYNRNKFCGKHCTNLRKNKKHGNILQISEKNYKIFLLPFHFMPVYDRTKTNYKQQNQSETMTNNCNKHCHHTFACKKIVLALLNVLHTFNPCNFPDQ